MTPVNWYLNVFDGFIYPVVGWREGAMVASIISIFPIKRSQLELRIEFPKHMKVGQFISHTPYQHQPICLADARQNK